MKHQKFDTVVVGSGASAYYAVEALNKAGQKVAIVDERPYGGTCALRGSNYLSPSSRHDR